jgi:hypothetical protein
VAGKIDSVVPSRAFGSTVGDDRVAAPPHPLVKLPAVQSSYRLPRTAVIGSQSHFAVGPFPSTLWFSAAGTSRSRLNAPTHPLFGLDSPSECSAVDPSHLSAEADLQAASLMGFRSLQHIPTPRVDSTRALPYPLRAAFRV